MSRPAARTAFPTKVFFGSPGFGPGRPWSALQDLLPGWELEVAGRRSLAGLPADAGVLAPTGCRVDAELIEGAGFGLVQEFGAGVDNIDVEAATKAGVWVCRLPSDLTHNADSVAELAILGILAGLRRLDEARERVRLGRGWHGPVGTSLVGTTTVVVGMGAIGAALAARLVAFGTTVVGVRADPAKPPPTGVDGVVGAAGLHEALAGADVVVCAATARPEAPAMFDAGAFAVMKEGAVFVNVARGSLVDTGALVAALGSGRVAVAALDVFDGEPLDSESPLARHPRVVATPHIGGMTTTMYDTSRVLFADNLARWSRGEPPHHAVSSPRHPR